ncbi:MAG: hypothetical protein GY792_05625 [Gammaproteobacteria bacterium]|nr:hypothetical protein [Gammaproteobacteria bacterium]
MTETRATYTTTIEPPPRSPRNRLLAVADTLDTLHEQTQEVSDRIEALEQAGIAYGRLFWDRGPRGAEKNVLKLAHDRTSPTRPDNKKGHEYIGKSPDPETVAEAEARLHRGKVYLEMRRRLATVEGQIADIERKISGLEMVVSRQVRLPGFDGE